MSLESELSIRLDLVNLATAQNLLSLSADSVSLFLIDCLITYPVRNVYRLWKLTTPKVLLMHCRWYRVKREKKQRRIGVDGKEEERDGNDKLVTENLKLV